MIFHNGHILTIDEDFSTGSAVAVSNGRVIEVGDQGILETYRDSLTSVIDLKGRTIIPGLIEPHTHPVASAMLYNWIDISGFEHKTAEQAIRSLKRAVRNTPKGKWIMAFGWDGILLDGSFELTKEYLDTQISNRHPIWIMMQSMHTHYFNSMAFDMAGIDEKIEDPPGGGQYVRDDKGRLTGMITESAPLTPILKVIPSYRKEEVKRSIRDVYTRYNSYGITTIGVTGLIEFFPGHKAIDICQELGKEDLNQLRVFVYEIGTPTSIDSIRKQEAFAFKKNGYKFWIDGSPYTGSMLMREPYDTSALNQDVLRIPPGSYGHQMLPVESYEQLFRATHDLGWQISAHSQGDSSTSVALEVYRKVLKERPRVDHRHRMEHLALATDDQMRSMAELGISPSFHINHLFYYGDALSESIVGNERAKRLMPVGSASRYKHRFTLHNDSPMYPPNQLLAARTAVTRMTSSGQVLGVDQSISVEDALRAITINAAWQLFAEDEIGSLEPGKKADLVILDQNPMQVHKEDLHKIHVLGTFIDGMKVY